MSPEKKRAIIILGHGSRVPDASTAMHVVARGVKERHGYAIVETCNMSRLGPHFDETFEKCVEQGATEVILIPYFLHEGLHIQVDIPTMMQHAAGRHPDVRLVLGKCLGFDDALVDLVDRRICESERLHDVRELALPLEEEFPLPKDQLAYIPMTPQQAQEWEQRIRTPEGQDG